MYCIVVKWVIHCVKVKNVNDDDISRKYASRKCRAIIDDEGQIINNTTSLF